MGDRFDRGLAIRPEDLIAMPVIIGSLHSIREIVLPYGLSHFEFISKHDTYELMWLYPPDDETGIPASGGDVLIECDC